MAKKITTATRKNAQFRRCSLCKKTGHAKSRCVEIERRADKRAGHVPVHILSQAPVVSPHIVRINHTEKISLPVLPVYAEKEVRHNTHQVVHWADMIKSGENTDVVTASATRTTNTEWRNTIIDGLVNLLDTVQAQSNDWRARFGYKKFVLTVVTLTVFVALPFPAFSYYQKLRTDTSVLVERSVNGFLSLQSSTAAVFSANLPQAEQDLNNALSSFSQAQVILEKEHRALVYVASMLPFVGDKVTSRGHILTAGHEVAVGNAYLVKGMSEVSASSSEHDFLDKLNIFKVHLRGSIPHYENALTELATVDTKALPVEYQQSFTDFRILFAGLVQDLKKTNTVFGGLETMLGGDQPRRYLVLFQNQHELRATGGFIGSVAIVDVQRGKITNLEVPEGGSYDFQGQLSAYVKPPLPLQMANARWEFQDANWFPDFPASAQKAAWFYQKSRGATVDGVIAINASVLEKLLTVMGPITNEQYGVVLHASDALEKLQTVVESDAARATNKPKAIIGAVLKQMLENGSAFSPNNAAGVMATLATALEDKEIQVYFSDEKLEAKFSDLGWTGEIGTVEPYQDYLFVVNTNIGGMKSDASITDKIEHEAVVQSDGSVLDTVIIKRKHGGNANAKYNRVNSSYLRVYVPKGSELIKAGGFVYPAEESFKVPEKWYSDDTDLQSIERERGVHVQSGTRITEEFERTVFGNWITTQPGEETEVWFTYKLPFVIKESKNPKGILSAATQLVKGDDSAERYSLFVQKQSGTSPTFSTQVIFPDGYEPIWRNRDDAELGINGTSWTGALETDQIFGVVVRNNSSQ